jgi:hypothetical protein
MKRIESYQATKRSIRAELPNVKSKETRKILIADVRELRRKIRANK